MKKPLLMGTVALGVMASAVSADMKLVDLPAPDGPPIVAPAPSNWGTEQAARQAAKANYLQEHEVAFDWFAHFPFSQVDGIPMVLLRLLPAVAPDIWGPPGDFGETFGLFSRGIEDSLPLPVGIGVSGLDPQSGGAVDYTSFTCGACHIGRVELGDGSLMHINGGVNAEFNIVKFFVDFKKTFDALADGASGDERKKVITAHFTQAAQDQSKADPNYFYGNATYKGLAFDADYEAAQVAAYLKDAEHLTGDLVDYMDKFVGAFGTYMNKTYEGYQSTMLAGLPGMADATGVSASHGYETLEETLLGKLVARELLPDHPGLTDFMVVWDQDARTARWNADGTLMIDGGGQYNGNIPIPIYRNLAASMTMGLKETDLRVAGFAAELLGGLPPEPYPFDVDPDLAARGQELFAKNCASCHQPNNGAIYRNIGTDPSRSMVVNKLLHKGAQGASVGVCNPDTELTLYRTATKPCAEFDGRPITKDDIMRPLDQQYGGYNATPLAGTWAAAPYLHTGSVPTMYHLLVPSERPDRFVKSALSYDTKHLGFAWRDGTKGGYTFDTTAFPAISKAGHDTDVTMDGTTYKLDWTDNLDGAWAIIEYLKTL